MDTFDILVIILSSTLAIFLIASIIALVYAIKLLKKLNETADSAKQAVENVESLTGTMKNVANGSLVTSMVSGMFDKLKRRSDSQKEK